MEMKLLKISIVLVLMLAVNSVFACDFEKPTGSQKSSLSPAKTSAAPIILADKSNDSESKGARSCSAKSQDGKKSCAVSCKENEQAYCSNTEHDAECYCK
jgi:hypothetical protein